MNQLKQRTMRQSKKDLIKHWAEFVIPAVFYAEKELLMEE